MSQSAATVVYQVRIGAPGDVTIGTPAATLTQADDLASVPVLSGPAVDPLKGSTVSMPFTLRCKSDTVLFTSSGRLTGLGRIAEIRRSTDGGSTFTAIAVGRISAMRETGRGLIEVSVSDEGWQARQAEIFATTDSLQVFPPGLSIDWYSHDAADSSVTFTVEEVSGDAVHFSTRRRPAIDATVPLGISHAIGTDLVPPEERSVAVTNSAGNFESLRFRTGGVDYPIISFHSTRGSAEGGLSHTGILGSLAVSAPGGGGRLIDVWVYISGHALSAEDTVDAKVYFTEGVRVSEHAPLHIGGANGVHPATLLKDILDGDYGGEPVRYDATAMTTLQALSMRPVWARITKPVNRMEWLQKNLLAPFGFALLVDTDLQLKPTALRQAQDLDPDTLTTLDATNSNGLTWEHTSRDLVTVVSWKSRRVLEFDPDDGADAADGFDTVDEKVADIEYDNAATLGKVYHRIETELIFDRNDSGRAATELAGETFRVFGDGPVRGRITVPDSSGVAVGDLVVLDHDTLKGFNPNDAARTGDRVVRLLSFIEAGPASTTFEWLDAGPDVGALDAPTIAITQDSTDLSLVDVAISDLPSGAEAVVEVDVGSTTPTTWRFVRAGVGDETVTFRLPVVTGTAFARARSVAPGRISSAWATDSVALTASPRITARVQRTGADATITWTNVGGTAGVRADYSVHSLVLQPSFGADTDYDVADGGFTLSSIIPARMALTVRLIPYPTFSGGSVSGTPGDPVVIMVERPKESRDRRGRPRVPDDRRERGDRIDDDPDTPTRGIRLFNDDSVPVTWTRFMDLAATGTDPFLKHEKLELLADGSADFGGEVSADTFTAEEIQITDGVSLAVVTLARVLSGLTDGGLVSVGWSVFHAISMIADEDGARIIWNNSRLGPHDIDPTDSAHNTGTSGNDTLRTVTIPADALGTFGSLRVTAYLSFSGTNAGKGVKVHFGNSEFANVTVASTVVQARFECIITNTATDAQSFHFWLITEDGDVHFDSGSGTIDTTVDKDLEIIGTLVNSGDGITLLHSHVEFLGETAEVV